MNILWGVYGKKKSLGNLKKFKSSFSKQFLAENFPNYEGYLSFSCSLCMKTRSWESNKVNEEHEVRPFLPTKFIKVRFRAVLLQD